MLRRVSHGRPTCRVCASAETAARGALQAHWRAKYAASCSRVEAGRRRRLPFFFSCQREEPASYTFSWFAEVTAEEHMNPCREQEPSPTSPTRKIGCMTPAACNARRPRKARVRAARAARLYDMMAWLFPAAWIANRGARANRELGKASGEAQVCRPVNAPLRAGQAENRCARRRTSMCLSHHALYG